MIFGKEISELMFEFVKEKNIKNDDIFFEEEISNWFKYNLPLIKENTIPDLICRMTTNDENRIHVHAKNDGNDDIFLD